jgi:hypothetical protein
VAFPPKFDLGPGQEVADALDIRGLRVRPHHGDAVDPAGLYALLGGDRRRYRQARAGLGPGASAWLNLRVYDITGRLFDGTNAHSYFDHRLERHDRQWFFTIGKPTSAACVELGLRSAILAHVDGRVDSAAVTG